jgi:type IV pilus assembly protein PilA
MLPIRHDNGFTLIELMIVVAIITILAAIAIPAYQDYAIRGQVSEGISLSTGAKTAVWDFFADRGRLPANNESAGLASEGSISGKYVSAVQVTDGAVTVFYDTTSANELVQSSAVTLSPITRPGTIAWVCKGAPMDKRYLPTACR